MTERPTKKGKAIELITGPDDPQGVLIREDPQLIRPWRVSASSTPFAFTSLEPVLTPPEHVVSSLSVPDPEDTQKNLFKDNAGRIRDE